MKAHNHLLIDRLKKEMKRVGVNARELSHQANVGRSFIYDILNGKSTNPTTKKIAAVAEVLGVSVPYLVNGSCNDNEVMNTHHDSHIGIAEIELFASTSAENQNAIQTKDIPLHFFHKSLLQTLSQSPSDILAFKIEGDCMAPTLQNNDLVLLDRSQTEPNPPGIFIIQSPNGGLVPKRIEFILKSNDEGIQFYVSSDNKQYNSYTCSEEDVRIIGRVVWFSRQFV